MVGAAGDGHGGWGYTRGGVGGLGGETDGAYVFETSLGIRMDVEAALAYLLVPPLGGVVLLVFEHKSDYVRSVLPSLSFVLPSEDGEEEGMLG